MRRTLIVSAAFVAVIALVAASGCNLLDSLTNSSPTSPSTTTTTGSLDSFVGTFSSSSPATTIGAATCGNLQYVVAPTSATSATVTFSATCATSVQVNGSGSGTLSGSTLAWNAQGTVTQGTITCPFSFTNGTATPEGTGLRVNYSGTVCGIAVSGSELLKKS